MQQWFEWLFAWLAIIKRMMRWFYKDMNFMIMPVMKNGNQKVAEQISVWLPIFFTEANDRVYKN